jgi:hypothetical protein
VRVCRCTVGGGGVAIDDDGSWERFYRRERPELRLDSDGHPSVFYSGIQYGLDRPYKQYSYSTANRVRGGSEEI